MKFIKILMSVISSSIFIIGISLFLLFIRDKIPAENMKSNILIIVCFLFILNFTLETIRNKKDKQYITKKLIIIIDVLQILAFLILCFTEFYKFDHSNIDILYILNSIAAKAVLTLSLLEGIKIILKSQRFEINKSEEN